MYRHFTPTPRGDTSSILNIYLFLLSMKKIFLASIIILLFIGGVWEYRKFQKNPYAKITSYEECANAGYPIMESYPPRCATPDGRSFTGPGKIEQNDLGETTSPQDMNQIQESLAITAAKKDLASRLSINISSINIKEARIKEWPDGCLGLASFGELCTQVIIPGYEVMLTAQNTEYRYRTDQTGSILKLEK